MDIGIEFGTIGVRKGEHEIEITTYRSESYDPKSRKPVVAFGDSLEGDLARRDFTVNAMAVRLPDRRVRGSARRPRGPRGRTLRTPVEPAISFGDDPCA